MSAGPARALGDRRSGSLQIASSAVVLGSARFGEQSLLAEGAVIRSHGAGVEVGRIRYSWRLLLSPPTVLDYVCAHECAHLIEANHSPRFWAVVHGLIGDERPHRAWLRTHGARLHAVGRA